MVCYWVHFYLMHVFLVCITCIVLYWRFIFQMYVFSLDNLSAPFFDYKIHLIGKIYIFIWMLIFDYSLYMKQNDIYWGTKYKTHLNNYGNASLQNTILHAAAPAITREYPTEKWATQLRIIVWNYLWNNNDIFCTFSTNLSFLVWFRSKFCSKFLPNTQAITAKWQTYWNKCIILFGCIELVS